MQILADRQDRSLAPMLEEIIDAHTDQFALEALWALNLSCGLNDRVALKTLDHPNPFVRQWTVRLLCDKATVSPAITDKLAEMASSEPHHQVRSQLASSAQRLPAKTGLTIVRNLVAHVEDTNDLHIPLLLWWAIEKKADSDRNQVLELFENPTFWDLPTVKQHLVERVMRRYALAGSRKDLQTSAKLLSLSPSAEHTKLLMSGFETAYKGRSLSGLPDELVKALAATGGTSLVLKVRQGDAAGIKEALKLIADEKTDAQKRIDYIQLFGEVKHDAAVPILLQIAESARDDRLMMASITSLQPYPNDAIAAKILSLYPNLSDDVRSVAHTLLSSRETWAEQLLNAVDSGTLPKSSVPVDVVRKLTVFRNDRISELIKKHWGTIEGQTTEQMQARIAKLKSIVSSEGEIGPDLTPFKRNDVHNIVANIVNPSVEIREGFETYLVLTEDGRTVTGFLVDRDTQVVVLRGADGQNITLRQSEIEEMIPQKKSLMPEGQLKDLTKQQVKDLFSYIRSSQPLNY
jgi:putative heme-binding domain-containing protein